jgi:hypothetical protein
VQLTFANKRPTLGHRLTASLAAAIVLALTVFAASPDLHNWLHSFDAAGSHQTHGVAHADKGSIPDDDDCAVVVFAQGVLAMLAIAFFGIFSGKVAKYSPPFISRLVSKAPEYWVPPLCGPPVS